MLSPSPPPASLSAHPGPLVHLPRSFLSLAALHKGLHEVVAASLLGSILSNLLLVLGTCFLVGGMKYKEQRFRCAVVVVA